MVESLFQPKASLLSLLERTSINLTTFTCTNERNDLNDQANTYRIDAWHMLG